MRHEYLIFDALLLGPPLVFSFFRRSFFLPRWPHALAAISVVALPFIVWDALVTGRHWWFNERFITGAHLGPLPLEEVLFFLAMPFACLFTWFALFRDRASTRPGLRAVQLALIACAPAGLSVLVAHGPEYTGAAVLALGLAALLDLATGAHLLRQPRFYLFLALVAVLNAIFNGYLTARPIVLYGEAHQLGVRVGTVPLEDFVYGFALVIATTVLYERLVAKQLLVRAIERRLGGYRQRVVGVDERLPARVDRKVDVLVVGSGIAGLTAATLLAERGFSVHLRERNAYLGGKVGAWRERVAPDLEVGVEHGFHAFFRQYYNLNRLLERVGVTKHYRAIDDYAIIDRHGAVLSFKDIARTPIVNLLSLAHHGIVPWRDLLTNPRLAKLEALLKYDRETTHPALDAVSFAEFSAEADLPPRLRLAFNTFARAFFAEERRMSMAELIKGFHFYYLSNDHGLLYDYLDDDYQKTLLAPFERHLTRHGARISLGTGVRSLERDGSDAFLVDGADRYDAVVLAADAWSSRQLLLESPLVQTEAPALLAQAATLKASQRYAVLRVWLDRDCPRKFPVFLVTERERILDAVTFNHWFQPEARAWADAHRGGVYEAHCYALPDDVAEADVQQLFLDELFARIPELRGAKVQHAHLQVRADFTAYHLGLYATRPGVDTGISGLALAGDWVKLPYPSMLMEGACMSGVLAANAIAARYGVRGEVLDAVPARGVLA